MFLLGLLLGFVGLGGAGMISALLIILFQVPVHLAFGTALGAMFATCVTGGWSHLREGNVEPVSGLQIGLFGIVGAYLGSSLALAMGARELKTVAGLILMGNSVMLYIRTRMVVRWEPDPKPVSAGEMWRRQLPASAAVGLVCGLVSGFFAIGAAPWIQVGLMLTRRTDLRMTIGTAMFALALMSLTGAVRFAQGGQIEPGLLLAVVLGLSVGSFTGARFTRRAPRSLVRWALIASPLVAGSLLILAPA